MHKNKNLNFRTWATNIKVAPLDWNTCDLLIERLQGVGRNCLATAVNEDGTFWLKMGSSAAAQRVVKRFTATSTENMYRIEAELVDDTLFPLGIATLKEVVQTETTRFKRSDGIKREAELVDDTRRGIKIMLLRKKKVPDQFVEATPEEHLPRKQECQERHACRLNKLSLEPKNCQARRQR